MKHSQSQSITQNDANSGWLSGWWGWYGTYEDDNASSSTPTTVVKEGPQTEGM